MQADEPDGLHVTKQLCGPRDIKVSSSCPPGLQRTGPWRIEDFDLHKRLYQGKASLLFYATCKRSKLPVAVKVYRKARLSELNWYQVEREIRIHSRLDHPNIIQLFAAFEDDANVYMVQEYATGGDLYEELKQKGGRFEEARTATGVLRPCISALVYLHSQGIIHRDIKPENILLMADKSIKLADFGLSIDATSERPVTRAGTLDYMAPEVLLCPEKSRPQENKDKVLLGYTAMVDAWAMGILAYELIVGKPPFEKQSRAATYEHIMYRKPEFPFTMSADAKDFVFSALTKAARKRPALASMLSHPWLAGPTQAPPPPAPQQLLLTNPPAPTGLSIKGGTPSENGPQTPLPFEGRQHQGMSPCTTVSDESTLSCEVAAITSDGRMAAGASVVAASAAGVQGRGVVQPQRSFQDQGQGPSSSRPSPGGLSKKDSDDEEGQRATTWTASLKRGMLKMLSKSSGHHSRATQEAAAAAVAATTEPQRPGDALAMPNSPPESRMSVKVMRPSHASSFKGASQSPTAAMLSPIASQTLSQGSPDASVRSSKLVVRADSSALSLPSSDAAQMRSYKLSLDSASTSDAASTRPFKPSLDLPSTSGQSRFTLALASAASLPASGLKGNFQPNSRAAPVSPRGSYREAGAESPPPILAPQPSQPVQTVQQMLAEMQQARNARESLGNGGKVSPRGVSVGTSGTDVGVPIPVGRARQAVPGGPVRDSRVLESPFAESLGKSFGHAVSRRYAMGGANTISSGSRDFTDYAGSHKGPADVLRGATSYPVNSTHRTAYAPLEVYGDGQECEVSQVQQSPPGGLDVQLTKRSQSLALPANMVLEANGRSASSRHAYKRADLVTRSSRPFTVKGTGVDDSGASSLLRAQLQQQPKADKAVPKRRITNQNIEPGSSKAAWLAQNALRDVDSPRVGSGLIKVGLGQAFEEDQRTGC